VEGHVTPLVPEWFKDVLREFFLCWRQTATLEMGRAYWATLSDCEQADVIDSGLTLRRTAGGEWPPSASTWHQAAKALERDRRLHDTIELGREQFWKAECHDCDDTGWQVHDCTAANRCGRPVCGQMAEAHTHTYATACPCRPTNRTYQRARDRERLYKREPTERQPRKSGGWTKASEART